MKSKLFIGYKTSLLFQATIARLVGLVGNVKIVFGQIFSEHHPIIILVINSSTLLEGEYCSALTF